MLENKEYEEKEGTQDFTLHPPEDGAACIDCLGAELQRNSTILLEHKINNTTSGPDNYAILPDLRYDITIMQS